MTKQTIIMSTNNDPQKAAAAQREHAIELRSVFSFGPGDPAVVEDELQVREFLQGWLQEVRAAWKPGEDRHLVLLRRCEQRVVTATLEQVELARFGNRHDSRDP